MKRLRVFSGLVIAMCGVVAAQPMADHEQPANPVTQHGFWGDPDWGDPDEPPGDDSDWTWFGMGYERRSGGSGSSPTTNAGSADGAAASTHQNQNSRR
jgi:hypothetical protein